MREFVNTGYHAQPKGYMSYSLNFLKGVIKGSLIGVIKGVTRSSDDSSHREGIAGVFLGMLWDCFDKAPCRLLRATDLLMVKGQRGSGSLQPSPYNS